MGVGSMRNRTNLLFWCLACIAFVNAGCTTAPKQADEVEKPRPVLVHWHDLANTDVPYIRDGYAMISPTKKGTLFPCSLAVARVTGLDGNIRSDRSIAKLAMTPANELIDWTQEFDDLWEISEVFPLSYPLAMRGRAVRIDELLERARDGGASLCLVYQVIDFGETFTEVRGAVFDTHTGLTLSALQAEAHGEPVVEDELPPPYPGRVETDRRHVDPHFMAQDSFGGFVRESVLELIARDSGQTPPARARLTAGH